MESVVIVVNKLTFIWFCIFNENARNEKLTLWSLLVSMYSHRIRIFCLLFWHFDISMWHPVHRKPILMPKRKHTAVSMTATFFSPSNTNILRIEIGSTFIMSTLKFPTEQMWAQKWLLLIDRMRDGTSTYVSTVEQLLINCSMIWNNSAYKLQNALSTQCVCETRQRYCFLFPSSSFHLSIFSSNQKR